MRGRAAGKGSATGGGRKRSRSINKTDQDGQGDSGAIKSKGSVGDVFMTKLGDGQHVTYPRQSLPSLRNSQDKKHITGYVRATPPGHMLRDFEDGGSGANHDKWNNFRSQPSRNGVFPKEGFDHILGESEIRKVDGVPIGGRIEEIDGPYTSERSSKSGCCLEPEEEEALQAELSQLRADLAHSMMDDDIESDEAQHSSSDGHEYGASRTPLDAPIGSLREKWRVLPHFLKLRGLMKQHIDSFDHFVSVEMKQIVQVSGNLVWFSNVIDSILPGI
jgi:hypothetical protein